jgi:hypothetical protein
VEDLLVLLMESLGNFRKRPLLGLKHVMQVTLGQTSTTTTFFFDGWNVVQEYTNGILARENILGEGLDQTLEYRLYGSPTRDYTVFRDLRGSTTAVVADDGSVELFKYLPFGKASHIDGSGDYNFDLSSTRTNPNRAVTSSHGPERGRRGQAAFQRCRRTAGRTDSPGC